MDRKDAPKNLKWDLSHIYKNHEEFEENYEKMVDFVQIFGNFKGKLKNQDTLLEYYKAKDIYGKAISKLYSYVSLNHDTDLNNNVFLEDSEKLNLLFSKYSKLTAYINPELASLDQDYLDRLLDDRRFDDYEYEIKDIINDKKHILNKEQEEALAVMTSFSSGFEEVRETMTENDFDFKPVIVKNKKEELTESTYSKYIKDKNRNVRVQAYNNLYETYKQFSKTLSTNYINFVKLINCDLTLRKYNNTFEMMNSNIPKEVFDNLIKNVNKNLNLEQKYFKILKNLTKIDDFDSKMFINHYHQI